MEIKSDKLVIQQSDRNEKGTQIDAEEKPAERVMETEIPISLSNGQSVSEFTKGASSGLAHTPSIAISGTAIEFASGYRGRCKWCKHFDKPRFAQWKKDVEFSTNLERRKVLDYLRGKLLSDGYASVIDQHQGSDGDLDVEHALMEFGICQALSHDYNDMFFVWPDAGCPMEDPKGVPMDSRFKARDAGAGRAGTSGYDRILKAAQGGPVKRKAQRIPIFNPKK